MRSVSLGTGGAQVESLNSNAVPAQPRDTFPPAPPERPSMPRLIRRRTARDLFRREQRDGHCRLQHLSLDRSESAETDWTKLNQALLTRTNYRDERVESGKTYYYYIVAVDNAGNVSQPSEVASETVP